MRTGKQLSFAAAAVLALALRASAFDGFITITNGYFVDAVTRQPFVPHGIAYQTWNRPLGVWQTFQQIDYDLDEMKKMGANSIRVDFVWQHIEEQGDNVWSWTNYDYLVQAAEKRGIRIFALVGYQWPPNWFQDDWYTMHPPGYDSGGIYHPTRWQSDIIGYEQPQARAQYAEWFSNVCGRYKDSKAIAGWIVGNEYGYLGLWSLKYDGYDPYCEGAFRTWCLNHYGSVTNLNAAWNTAYTNFGQIILCDVYAWKGTNGAEWADMVQWHEDSIASFTALGAAAARAADTNHLLSYSTVGMQWGEEDWRYHAEDRGKIARACASNNAALGFFSINNYPWAMDGSETRNGRWGVSYTKKTAGVPVVYSETGFTSSETLFPGMTLDRQGVLIRNTLWESLEAGAIGTHIFAWHDRPYITDREKGFGILYADRVIKPAFWTSRDTFTLMDQVEIGKHLMGSQDSRPMIGFLWDDATDSQYIRFENEMQHEAGALLRLGYEPNFLMGVNALASGEYTNYRAIVLPRNMRVSDTVPGTTNSVLNFLLTQVIPKGIHVIAVADLPGMQDRWGKPRAAFSNEAAQLFGIDASDVGGNFPPGTMDDSIYWDYYHRIDVRYNAAAAGRLTNYVYAPSVWKYNDRVKVGDGTLWAVMNTGTNRGYEASSTTASGWNTWGNVAIRQWGWQYEGTNMVQLWGWSGMWHDFQVIPGQRYSAGAYMRNNSDDGISNGTYGVVLLEWYDANSNQIGSSIESGRLTAPNNAWQFFSAAGVAPSNVAFAREVRKLDRPTNSPIGSLYFDSDTYSPAVVVKNHGAAKAVIILHSLDCLPDGNGDSQPDNLPYKWRYDILGGILEDYCGIAPAIRATGTNAYLCLPTYRTCTNGAVLMQVKNYLYDTASPTGGAPQTFTIQSTQLVGKTIRAFDQCRVIETNSDGVFPLTLAADGQEMLLAYNPPGGTNLFVQIANAPSVVHPYGDQSYGIAVKYDTGGRTGLVLKVAFMENGDNGDGKTNEIYQVLATNAVAGAGGNTFWLWIPDPDQDDPDYASTPDGGNYIIKAWLEDASSNVLSATVPQTTELKWGIAPLEQVPLNINKGDTTNLPVTWQDLDEQLYWQNTPLTRSAAFPNRVGVYRSLKTQALYSNQFDRVNAVCDWLETLGYESANPMDVAFDNVSVMKTSGTNGVGGAAVFSDPAASTNGWTATGLWHLTADNPSSPTNSWAYNNGTNYSTGSATVGALTSPWIALTGSVLSATLRFRSWYETEDLGTAWDRKTVLVSTNGSAWSQVAQISGTNKQWATITVDLQAYAGKTIQVRFQFDSIDAMYNQYKGWQVDDIEVLAFQGTPVDLFYDSMEGTTNWTADGSMWHIATARTASGTNAWVYNDGTDYDTGSRNSGSLVSRWIDLSDASSASLTFRSWYKTEDNGTAYDRKLLYVSTNGTAWTRLLQVTGPDSAWTTESYDLGAYVGQRIRLRFTFDTIDAINNAFEGWYVDDVRITTFSGPGSIVYGDDAESGTNEWSASGLWHQATDLCFSAVASWAYNNGVNYSTGGRNSGELVSRWIDLTGASSASLAFRSWYETEDTGLSWDRKIVSVTTNGSSWVQLTQVSGPNKQWTAKALDLSAYAGQRIRLKFSFDSIDGVYNTFRGWYIDDVRVRIIGSDLVFLDGFGGAAIGTNWTRVAGAANWTLDDGTLRAWRIGNDDNILCAGDNTWSNYTLSADLRYNQQGPYFNDAEIYVRYRDRNNFVKVGIHNFYGFWRLKYTVRIATNNLYQGWVHEFSRTNQPAENTWYNLKIRAETNTYRVFLNGENVGSFTDTNFPTGRIAIGTKAVQLGIWEPAAGYFFIDDDEYAYYSAHEGDVVTLGKPLNLDWGYLVKFFPILVLPGTYVMNDTEASNVVTWLTNGWFSLLATDGGVAMKDETGADDRGRLESLFGVGTSITSISSLAAITVGTNEHYATLDYKATDQLPLSGAANAWQPVGTALGLGTMDNGAAAAPALICNVITQKIDSPPKVFCFNYNVDVGGQLTNGNRLLAQRAFEWLKTQTYKLTLELKWVVNPLDPNFDKVVFTTNFWTLNGWGTNALNVQIPMDNVMTGTNLYWVMYTYPWDATNAWRTHKGFFSSGDDSSAAKWTTLGGFGLQLLGITDNTYGGRDWDMWVAYNTQGSNLVSHFGLKEQGSFVCEDNFRDGDYAGWTVDSNGNGNIAWSVSNGALQATVVSTGGYQFVTRDGLSVTGRNITIEYNTRFVDGATNAGDGGVIYRGRVLYVNPKSCGWADSNPAYVTNYVPATNRWNHVMVHIRDGAPYLSSDLYVNSKPVFLAEPIEVTNWTSDTIGFLAPYYKGYQNWDNVRVVDEEYSMTTQAVAGYVSPTNANFWPSAPDYDPAMWEYDGTTAGGQYEWYIYFRGEGVHGYQGTKIYFSPRLMVEDAGFPDDMNWGDTVQVPVEWEMLGSNQPARLTLNLQNPYTAATWTTNSMLVTNSSGSAYVTVTLPTNIPAAGDYQWSAYLSPTNATNAWVQRIGSDDTFRFDPMGLPVEPETIIWVHNSAPDHYTSYSDLGAPEGAVFYTWQGYHNGDYTGVTPPEGSKSWYAQITDWSVGYAGWGVFHTNKINLNSFSNLQFWVKSEEPTVKVQLEVPQGVQYSKYLDQLGWSVTNGSAWQLLSAPITNFGASIWTNLYGSFLATLEKLPTRRAIALQDSNTIWVAGSEGGSGHGLNVKRSTNAGVSWAWVDVGASYRTTTMYDMDFGSWSNGCVVGDYVILITTNGGATWTPATSGVPASVSWYGVDFINSSTGWVCGAHSNLLKTTDGGQTWSPQASGTNQTLQRVRFLDAQQGWACGYDTMLHTTNAGATWALQVLPVTGNWWYDVAFVNSATGWVCGSNRRVCRTTDGGATWSSVANMTVASGSLFMNMSWPTPTNGWIAGWWGELNVTRDGGVTWTNAPASFAPHFYDVLFADANRGYAVGNIGTVIATTNGASTATTWTEILKSREFCIDNVRWTVNP